ncbi:UPF0301 protein YqgE [Buchnera aphidicola (Chaitophorus sp. 3695)]|uniref:YqgE/AlgH family protein n=1 Tax=Buchnera aphidicola TaxID=9 RepID=UPI003463F36C
MNIVNFKNHFLISMPNLSNTFFDRSVIYIYQDDYYGINGVIINKKIKNLKIENFYKKIKINFYLKKKNNINKSIILGGPLENNKGLILHSLKKNFLSDIYVSSSISITLSKDILESLKEKDLQNTLIILGHCSWKKKQLEREISNNDWLISPSNKKILFHTKIKNKWKNSIKLLGIKNINQLNLTYGQII